MITPKETSEWSHIDLNSFERRKNLLINFTEEVIEKLKSDGKEKKEDGYLDRLGSKIVDNIQIHVKNIHIRFEDSINYSSFYSMGFTLTELSMFTCNEEWKEDYIDRTNKDNKDMPLLKLLKLKNFAFYFQNDEKAMVSLDCDNDDDWEVLLHGLFPIDADVI